MASRMSTPFERLLFTALLLGSRNDTPAAGTEMKA